MDVEKIAKGLSGQQRRYLLAVAAEGKPYEPRHGRTASWAIQQGLVYTVWLRDADQKAVPWPLLPAGSRGSAKCLGAVLTTVGLAVREYLEKSDEADRA